ncbi:glycosyltransferase [Methanobrevibacter sp. OttesenSCG-928-K11]|nr:glycosyltransferase [Methanobrevibacter sp. OttesenSCG-928-K11]MDL2271167.1 glycosyltransferase [Methanobrevibacter sp. OttesenSCG-928-I08]
MYKLSVVVPTFNTGKFLLDLFDSLKEQSIGFNNIEVIFVDDASTDKFTIDLINELISEYSNCKAIFLKENSGFPGKPRNIGIENSSAEYVIVTDHDDTYEKDALKILYETITTNNADMVISNYYNVFPNKKEKVKTPFSDNYNDIKNIEDDLRFFDIGPSIWTKLFKKEFLYENNIKFPEGMLGEDLYFYINSLIDSSKTIYLSDFCAYNYRIRDSDEDKSTIHIRNKKYLQKMIEGYYKTWNLLKKKNMEKYFSNIFLRHLVYWLTSFIASNINDSDKEYLIKEINPLLKKQLSYTPNFNEKIYSNLSKPILEDDYDKIVNVSNKIKKSRNRKEKIKKLLPF